MYRHFSAHFGIGRSSNLVTTASLIHRLATGRFAAGRRRTVRIPINADSEFERLRTAVRRKPDSNSNEAGQHPDDCGQRLPFT
jgi:hypothetical protein